MVSYFFPVENHACCLCTYPTRPKITSPPHPFLPWHGSLLGEWRSRITQVSVHGKGMVLISPNFVDIDAIKKYNGYNPSIGFFHRRKHEMLLGLC